MLPEDIKQIFARLTVHEFMLEILYAQHWSNASESEAQDARKEILRLMRSAYVSADADLDGSVDALEMLQDANALAERFLEKVTLRADQIREAKARVRRFQERS